jgi:hypothetical protein
VLPFGGQTKAGWLLRYLLAGLSAWRWVKITPRQTNLRLGCLPWSTDELNLRRARNWEEEKIVKAGLPWQP